jgi:hypothetical protein
MARNLKALGLALVAALAISAPAASAQQGVLTSDGPVTLDLTATRGGGGTEGITTFGERIECPGTTYAGHKYNVTPHELIPIGAHTITITPHFVNCKTASAPNKATLTMNGCDYVFSFGQTVAQNKYPITAEVACPVGAAIEFHEYLASNNENISVCTLTVRPQSGIMGLSVTTNTISDDLNIAGTLKGIHVEKHGLCGSGTSVTGEYHMDLTVQGTSIRGENTGITVTD